MTVTPEWKGTLVISATQYFSVSRNVTVRAMRQHLNGFGNTENYFHRGDRRGIRSPFGQTAYEFDRQPFLRTKITNVYSSSCGCGARKLPLDALKYVNPIFIYYMQEK